MSKLSIYHNPRCKKSRDALQYLNEKGEEPVVIEYLKQPIDKKDFELLLARLNMTPQQLLRTGEQLYKEKYRGKKFSDEEWLQVLIENPKLIERPIVVKGNKAVVGRPLDNVKELIEK